ncbi:hypothetical protein R1flu_003938 [Riccia fluitans]|uniref:Uncharacterized protein n=1 Tax=Riccia fluitans TaxID=41844 RepID=A0ABD1XDZ5_9MARC
MLRDTENQEITEESAIMDYVHRFYADLYSQPHVSIAELREQEMALNFISHRVTLEENRRLTEVPGAEELERTVKSLPLEKSPGEDGLPVEVLRELWEETRTSCLQFVQEVWKTKRVVIKLTRALVADGHAKIHLKGKFTKSFKLQRRVWQAARLFADDSGVTIRAEEINFTNLCNIIKDFEKLSGAQLNPAKSVLIPFALERPPTWLQEKSCQILTPGQFITYLGCRFGLERVEEERANDMRSKIQSKLGKWANRFLTWPPRVMLLQHVLRALPVYHFLGLGLKNTSYKQLETSCHAFLWGTNAEGKPKMALVKWDSITKLRINGGLQIRSFQRVSEALKMRYVG